MSEPSFSIDNPAHRKAYGLARILVCFIPIGFLLMVCSLLESSVTWAGYVCMTGWWGIVMGLNGARSLKRQCLDPESGEAQASWLEKQLWGLFMFWLPTLMAVVLGGLVYNFLQEDHRPQGFIGKPFIVLESLAMYFLAAGFAWTGVYGEGGRASTSPAVATDSKNDAI